MATRRNRGRRRVWPYLILALLAGGVGFLAAHLLRDWEAAPEKPAAPARREAAEAEKALREILGPLEPGGIRVTVRDRPEAQEVLASVERVARRHPESVSVTRPHGGKDELRATLRVGSRDYPLEVRWLEPSEPAPRPASGGARLALVIDDFGVSVDQAKAFLDLEIPITPAVIPHLHASLQVAHLARERGREFLLHLPMQPQGFPKVNPGEGALLASMPEPEIRRRVGEALSSVPGASGVNNHMGSRLTELEAPMGWVMDELRKRDLFFLDSMTSPKSVAGRVAKEAGVGWAKRDVFLDNEESVEAIGKQLGRALEKAKTNGGAIAIGHPHPSTLQVLREWTPRIRESGVEIVPLGQLIRRGEG